MQKLSKFLSKNKYLWYSFAIPLVLLFILYFVEEIVPFGTKSATLYDSSHQYVPFLTEYYTKLKEGSSLQFSMSMGLGQDFFLIWSYYLSSPINFLLLLFKKEDLLIAINIITAIKIALCSFAATIYLKNKFKKIDIQTLSFGLLFGLSSYVMSYFCNIMWMDVVFAFPILIMYFERMLKGEKKGFIKYSLVLSYCFVTNFYLSIPVCLFLCLYFFVCVKSEFLLVIRNGLKFALYSILSAGIAGFVLLPNIYYFIKYGESLSEGTSFEVLENFFTFLSRHFYLIDTQVDVSFKPGGNIYCGIITILLFFLYMFNTQIKLEEKIKKALLIIFLILSMNIKVLNFIWHGFDYPTGYVNRFSFIYIFILISMGYECMIHIKKINTTNMIIAFTCSFLLLTHCYIYEASNDLVDEYKLLSYQVTAGIALMYMLFFFLNKHKKIKKKTFINISSKLIMCEIIFYMIFGFTSYGFMNANTSYEHEGSYKILKRYATENFVRSDIDYRKLSNESTQYGLDGVSFFSSTIDRNFASVINKLGHRAGTNFYSIKGNNPLTQILFNIGYLYNESYYYSIFENIDSDDDVYLYKNIYDTYYGYLFDTTFEGFDYKMTSNPFILQNKLVSAATDDNIEFIYMPISNKKISVSSANTNFVKSSYEYIKDDNNDFICKVTYDKDDDFIYELNYKYICENDNDIAINIDPNDPYACNIKVNGTIKVSDYKIANEVVVIGNLNTGDEVNVNIKIKENSTDGTLTCYFAQFNKDQFDKFYNYITKEKVETMDLEDGKLTLSLKNSSDKLLFISLPNLEGWSVYDNGEKLVVNEDSPFIAINLPAGEHLIKLKYNTPMLNYGIMLSVVSIVILIMLILKEKRIRK